MVLGGAHRCKGQGGLGLCLEILALQLVRGRLIIWGILEEEEVLGNLSSP